MLLESKASKVILAFIAILLLVNTAKDWLDFGSCGAVSACLSDAGTLQLYLKFSMSFLLTVLAFVVTADAFSAKDGTFLRVAFVFSLLADFSFSMIKAISPDSGNLSNGLGIAFFMVFQAVLIYRHFRRFETDTSFPKIYWALVAVIVAVVVLFAIDVLDFLPAVTFAYAFFVIASMVVGMIAPRLGYFPARNAQFIRWGMVTFFFGDVLVGLALITGDDHSTVQMVSAIANNFIWWLYVPAQLMLIHSTAKPQA